MNTDVSPTNSFSDFITPEKLLPYSPDKSLGPLIRVLSSDRLTKDVDTLMNSPFWIEALKTKKARGVSEQLNCNLLRFYIF